MNALETAMRVSSHPTVQAYDRSLARFHARMLNNYGPDFMEPHTTDTNGIPVTYEGVNRWTPNERKMFTRLYQAAQTYRASVRARYSA